eukprot:gene876-1097_t
MISNSTTIVSNKEYILPLLKEHFDLFIANNNNNNSLTDFEKNIHFKEFITDTINNNSSSNNNDRLLVKVKDYNDIINYKENIIDINIDIHDYKNTRESQKFLIFTFPGQSNYRGYIDFGSYLYENQPKYKEMMDLCDSIFKRLSGESMFDTIKEITLEQYQLPLNFYPISFSIQYSLYHLYKHWGVEATANLGFSFGETIGYVVGGFISLENGCELIYARAKLVDQLGEDNGKLLMAFINEKEFKEMSNSYPLVEISCYFSLEKLVLGGFIEDLERLKGELTLKGKTAFFLNSNCTFHNSRFEVYREEYVKEFSRIFKSYTDDNSKGSYTWETTPKPLFSARKGGLFQEKVDAKYLVKNSPNKEEFYHDPIYYFPIIFMIQFSLACLYQDWNVKPSFIMAVSFGEICGMCINGLFSLETACKIISIRAKIMKNHEDENSRLLSVPFGEKEFIKIYSSRFPKIEISCYFGDNLLTLGSDEEQLKEIQKELKQQNKKSHFLNSVYGYHTSSQDRYKHEYMESFQLIKDEIENDVKNIGLKRVPYFSTKIGGLFTEDVVTSNTLYDIIREPVYYKKTFLSIPKFIQTSSSSFTNTFNNNEKKNTINHNNGIFHQNQFSLVFIDFSKYPRSIDYVQSFLAEEKIDKETEFNFIGLPSMTEFNNQDPNQECVNGQCVCKRFYAGYECQEFLPSTYLLTIGPSKIEEYSFSNDPVSTYIFNLYNNSLVQLNDKSTYDTNIFEYLIQDTTFTISLNITLTQKKENSGAIYFNYYTTLYSVPFKSRLNILKYFTYGVAYPFDSHMVYVKTTEGHLIVGNIPDIIFIDSKSMSTNLSSEIYVIELRSIITVPFFISEMAFSQSII